MSSKHCCSNSNHAAPTTNVNVTVDVPKIVKYTCVAGVLIVAIVFATKCFLKMLEEGFFELVEE